MDKILHDSVHTIANDMNAIHGLITKLQHDVDKLLDYTRQLKLKEGDR